MKISTKTSINKILAGAFIASALTLANNAFAAEYTIDTSHSQVGFKVKHMMISNVPGSFGKFEGTINFDEKKLKDAKVNVKIATDSINTNDAKRDDHLKSADFFDVKKYPEITFVSKSVTAAGKKKYKVKGDLTMHGVTKEEVLNAEFNGTGTDPWGNKKAGFSATATLKRKDYGMTWNKALDGGGVIVGDEVHVDIQIEALAKKEKDSAQK